MRVLRLSGWFWFNQVRAKKKKVRPLFLEWSLYYCYTLLGKVQCFTIWPRIGEADFNPETNLVTFVICEIENGVCRKESI